MAWWNILSNGEKVVDTATDLVKSGASGIDMLFFTDEERAMASAKIMEQVIELHKANADQNSIRSRVRRMLAVIVLAEYLLLLNISVGLGLCDKMALSQFVFKVANDALGSTVLAIVIFYFGYYGINAIARTIKS